MEGVTKPLHHLPLTLEGITPRPQKVAPRTYTKPELRKAFKKDDPGFMVKIYRNLGPEATTVSRTLFDMARFVNNHLETGFLSSAANKLRNKTSEHC
jgi:hypothetical protein